MAKILSLSNQKGGSGKTTISANLSVLWSNSGYKVGIIDADNQKRLSNWYNLREKYYGSNDTGIILIKSDPANLSEKIREIRKNFDYILIDSPPSITIDTINIVRASNYVLMPVQPSPIDLLATIPFLDLVNKISNCFILGVNLGANF